MPATLQTDKKDKKLVFVTGLSGAGMSTVLNNMEDEGYEVFDNLPLSLVEPLLSQEETEKRPVAIVIDSRTRGFCHSEFSDTIERNNAYVVYVTCDDAIIQKRYTETRRKHPMAKDRPVADGIRIEHGLLEPVKNVADLVIDTTNLNVHDLRRVITGHFSSENANKINITIMSFGYKYGIPRESDIVMDVRFLRNPHWSEKLRPLTGENPEIGEYIRKDPIFDSFIASLKQTLSLALSGYNHEGKNYLTIAIGCTGGRHRSVFVTGEINNWLIENGYNSHIIV